MKIALLLLIAFFSITEVQSQTNQLRTKAKSSDKITYVFCGGTGSGLRTPLICMNCLNWSAE